MDVWLHSLALPGRVARVAARAEEWGFDGLLVADSQSLNADVWVELGLAAAATERIGIGPGVTNPATRHPAVTASAAATLQAESGGRAVLGVGRGDSAVSQLGKRPVATAELERFLVSVQGYLRGEPVELDGASSRIAWLEGSSEPKVPVAVAATGPRTMALAARLADRVDLTVGAEPARLRWAIETVRAAGGGRPPIGAYLNVAVHPDPRVARELVRGTTAVLARFATEGAPPDGLSDVTRRGIARLASGYDRRRHAQASAPQARQLGDEFIDRFAIAGPAGEVAERLAGLAALGLDRVVIVPWSLDADPALVEESTRRLAAEVLPALRS